MRKKRVVFLSNHSVLATGIQKLLQEEEGFELHIILADDPEVKAEITRRRPEIIILDSGDASLGEGVITSLLEENPETRVVAMNVNHNGLKVYQMKQMLKANLDQLLETLRGEGLPPRPKRGTGPLASGIKKKNKEVKPDIR